MIVSGLVLLLCQPWAANAARMRWAPTLVSYAYFEKDDIQRTNFDFFLTVGMGVGTWEVCPHYLRTDSYSLGAACWSRRMSLECQCCQPLRIDTYHQYISSAVHRLERAVTWHCSTTATATLPGSAPPAVHGGLSTALSATMLRRPCRHIGKSA
jgi:hypothetical protein